MPGQGSKSTRNYNVAWGLLVGIFGSTFDLPVREMGIQRWKRHFNLWGKDKKESITRVKELYPNFKIGTSIREVNLADAILIAKCHIEMDT